MQLCKAGPSSHNLACLGNRVSPRKILRSPAYRTSFDRRRTSLGRTSSLAGDIRKTSRAVSAMGMTGTAQPGLTTLGFVGIGIMGLPMATNLVKAGYKLVVYNRNSEKCTPLLELGAEVASSAREVAEKADCTFAIVSDPQAALAIALGDNGVVAGLSPGKGYVDVSTVDAETSRKIGEAVAATGASFLEAPVSGSKGPAEAGALIFLCGGDRSLFDYAQGPFEVMGKANLFLGETGQGAKMKLVVNMVMGSMTAALGEGLCLAEQTGLDQNQVVEVLGLGAMACPLFALKGPNMVKEGFSPAFPLKHQQKDLRLALLLGDEVEQSLPVAAAANQLFVSAREKHGDDDMCAVVTALRKSK